MSPRSDIGKEHNFTDISYREDVTDNNKFLPSIEDVKSIANGTASEKLKMDVWEFVKVVMGKKGFLGKCYTHSLNGESIPHILNNDDHMNLRIWGYEGAINGCKSIVSKDSDNSFTDKERSSYIYAAIYWNMQKYVRKGTLGDKEELERKIGINYTTSQVETFLNNSNAGFENIVVDCPVENTSECWQNMLKGMESNIPAEVIEKAKRREEIVEKLREHMRNIAAKGRKVYAVKRKKK